MRVALQEWGDEANRMLGPRADADGGSVRLVVGVAPSSAVILWSDPDARVIQQTPVGLDIFGGTVKRDDHANDALYFKFRVDPLSDAANEPYDAVFQLLEGDENRLAVGNAPDA